jgi:hypothetical protein
MSLSYGMNDTLNFSFGDTPNNHGNNDDNDKNSFGRKSYRRSSSSKRLNAWIKVVTYVRNKMVEKGDITPEMKFVPILKKKSTSLKILPAAKCAGYELYKRSKKIYNAIPKSERAEGDLKLIDSLYKQKISKKYDLGFGSNSDITSDDEDMDSSFGNENIQICPKCGKRIHDTMQANKFGTSCGKKKI